MPTTKIVSAFPGCGKTHFFSNPGKYKVLDSDSSTFDKAAFPANYIKHIKANVGKADFILVSSHDVVRDALVAEGIDFTLVYPRTCTKDEYLKRYKDRGNDDAFVALLDKNWQEWTSQLYKQEGCKHIPLGYGEYLSDVIENL